MTPFDDLRLGQHVLRASLVKTARVRNARISTGKGASPVLFWLTSAEFAPKRDKKSGRVKFLLVAGEQEGPRSVSEVNEAVRSHGDRNARCHVFVQGDGGYRYQGEFKLESETSQATAGLGTMTVPTFRLVPSDIWLALRLSSLDQQLIDGAVRTVVKATEGLGCESFGPIPLPSKKPSAHALDGLSSAVTHRRQILIRKPPAAFASVLQGMTMPSGVDVEMVQGFGG